jgi:hypothetical protein
MRSQQTLMAWSRICGLFLIFLAVFDLAISLSYFYQWHWLVSSSLLPAIAFVFYLGCVAIVAPGRGFRASHGGGGAGLEEAGVPVPIRPAPTHHLVAAKDLPPSPKTHSLPKD